MDERQQVHSVAALLIEKHGLRAVSFADHQALKAQHRGDEQSANGWRSVATAAAALLKTGPEDEF